MKLNDYQKHRFAKQIIDTLFNTVSGKKIAFLGWAFKKDTNDTRESAAIYVADELLHDKAEIHIYDPKVTAEQIFSDLEYLQLHRRDTLPAVSEPLDPQEIRSLVKIHETPYSAADKAHAIAILTEWDEFAGYNWVNIYANMQKPAFLFDGRNVMDGDSVRDIGFIYQGIGK